VIGNADEVDRLRLVTKVARLYHARGLRQTEIAERLRLSQPRVSRLLAQAEDLGIVRSTVAMPPELNRDLEEGLRKAYGLRAAHVVDAFGVEDEELTIDLGSAAAPFLSATFAAGDVGTVGFMSWSRTMRHLVQAMRPVQSAVRRVVEMLGDLGAPTLQQDVSQLTQRLATLSVSFLAMNPIDDPSRIMVMGDKEGFHPNIENKLNVLYADGHASQQLTFVDDTPPK